MKNFVSRFTSNKPLMTFMVIVGTVIGSGFLSGKEIVVFFSRFGKMSYFCIFLAFLLFWGLFYYFLKVGSHTIGKLNKSKFARGLNFFICLILSSAMFAGVGEIIEGFALPLKVLIYAMVLFLACKVALYGARVLDKLNLILVPIMVVFMITNLTKLFSLKTGVLFQGSFYPFSIFFCILYVILNTSNSAIVISSFSSDLTKSQKVQVSFFSALALSLILLFANIVLLQNSFVFGKDMPLLSLVGGGQKMLMSIIIMFGCCTTLFSLVYTVSSSLRGVRNNKFFILFLSVFLPFCLNFLGFGFIVSVFYPMTSVFGIFLLCDLFCVPLFKKVYNRIHSTSKNAKKQDAGHDKV